MSLRYITIISVIQIDGSELTTDVYLRESIWPRPAFRTQQNIEIGISLFEKFTEVFVGDVVSVTPEEHELLCDQAQIKDGGVNPRMVLAVMRILQSIYSAPKKDPRKSEAKTNPEATGPAE